MGSKPLIIDYASAAAVFSTARSKAAGKPLGNGYWLQKELNGDFCIRYGGENICRITPENILTVNMSMNYVNRHKYSITRWMFRLVKLSFCNMGKGEYRVLGGWAGWEDHRERRKTAPQYYPGIQFQLPGYKCLNPQPDMGYMVDKDKRKAWLADMRHMRTTLCAMAKVGALSRTTMEMSRVARVTPEKIVEAMKSREYSPEFVDNFVGLALQRVGWWRGAPSNSLIAQRIRQQINAMSVELRVAYGVLHGEAPKPRIVL